jgi:heptosyltransferase-2
MTGTPVPYDSLRRVCIRAPNWVGDVVMATPAFRAIRQHLPGAQITLVIRERVAPVVRGVPWFDQTVLYGAAGSRVAGAFLRTAGALRRQGHELGFVLPNSFSSALMFRLGRVARRVGYARDIRSFLLTDALPRPSENGRFRPTYMVDYYLGLCEAVGVRPAGRATELTFTGEEMEGAKQLLRAQDVAADEKLFLMHPGAGFGPSKRWPSERFSRLAELLQGQYGARVALIGGPAERETSAAIRQGSRARIADLSAAGLDLHALKCVVALSSLLVTTDSGPRHYGVALGVPTVCLMGPTDPRYSTSGRPHDHVVRLDVDCGPCQRKSCRRGHRCMVDITAGMAFEACRSALAASDKAAET